MIFDWPKVDPPNPKNEKKSSAETSSAIEGSRAEAKEGVGVGGKPPLGLAGLGGSEVQKRRRFGGSEKGVSERRRIGRTAGDLHADPMGGRIIYSTFAYILRVPIVCVCLCVADVCVCVGLLCNFAWSVLMIAS